MKYLLGIDLGSSSVKASLLEVAGGRCAGSAFAPRTEMEIHSPEPGFAEQDPEIWFECGGEAVREVLQRVGARPDEVGAVGIAYQMHGLVCVDEQQEVLRPAILWCDSRAVPYGRAAFEALGADLCLGHLLNSPGNFTASKLAWVKDKEPELFERIDKILLPGDWLAMKLTGEACTTVPGLSEGMFWDFKNEEIAGFLLDYFGFDRSLLARVVPVFGEQGVLCPAAASAWGLRAGTPVSYRAGDVPNSAFSLKVLEPGEVAATAGTSAVVYGVTGSKEYDPQSRVNTFVHVDHAPDHPRLGILLCINSAGILNAWTRRLLGDLSYREMDGLAASVPVGSDGLVVLPFGNGAERVLGNRDIGAEILGIDFRRHGRAQICRAVQEGVVFAMRNGMEVMAETGLELSVIRAGYANMFQSEVFCKTLAQVSGAAIELYDTDGAMGAARGAGVGVGVYTGFDQAFANLERRSVVEPGEGPDAGACAETYARWKARLERRLEGEKA